MFYAQRSVVLAEAQKRVTSSTGVIVCSVADEKNLPLEQSSVAILDSKDSSLISGAITNQSGYAIVDNIPWGTYLVRVTFMGYKTLFVNDITISKEKPIATTGRQQLQSSSNRLEGVTITAQKEMIETNLDKRVFNVDKSIIAEGATGTDVLENIPSVTVDLEGNVSLRGSQSVTILVNGRPTSLSMDEIPASTIERIEVVTNPSARHDPEGTSGIINIVLKKERKLGFNASLSLGAGVSNLKKDFYFGKYSATLNLNFRYDKFNFFFNYSFRTYQSNSEGDMTRESTFGNISTILSQQSANEWKGMPQGVRGGMDYAINKYNTIAIEGGYRYRSGQGESNLSNLIQNPSLDTLSFYEQNSYSPPIGTSSWDAAINYVLTTNKKGQELAIDISTSEWSFDNENSVDQLYRYPSVFELYRKTITTAKSNRITAKADFVTPIGKGGRIETGYKFDWNNTKGTYQFLSGNIKDDLTEDTNRNDVTTYLDNINAIYFVYSNTIKTKFKYQLGLRGERAAINSQLKSDTVLFTPDPYYNLFPTVHLRYDFDKIHSMQLGYSMRIRRPRGRELNPFLDDNDKQNLSQGNRKLKPEYTQSVELGYMFTKQKTSISANVFFRYKYDIITRYTVLWNDSTTYTTFENLNNSYSYGLEFSYQQDLFKFWKLNLNASLFQTLINDTLYDRTLTNDLSWQIRLNNNFNLPKDFQIQLSANYRSPTLTLNSMGMGMGGGGGMMIIIGAGQGRMSAIWGIDLGLRKSFLKKSLSISLRVSDIFNTRQPFVTSTGTGYTSEMHRYRDSRQVWLTVTYSIMNYKSKRQRERELEAEFDEMM
jgi:outer membrane receptor protein involved in Fe transport